jgi:hypothetical protein
MRIRRVGGHSIAWHGRQSRVSHPAGCGSLGRQAIIVGTTRQMRGLNLALAGARRDPVVLLALAVERDEPALSPTLLRTAADRSARIYLLPGLHPFHRPGVIAANPHLALPRGCVRICWPLSAPVEN